MTSVNDTVRVNAPRPGEIAGACHPAGREFGPDLTRAVATVLLVILHGLMVRTFSFGPTWWLQTALIAMAKLCVPLFLLLSGYLIMRHPIVNAGDFYRRRFARILIPLAVGTVIALGWRAWWLGSTLAGVDFFRILLGQPAYYHLWYLVLLLPLTFATPWLQQLTQAMTPATFRIFLGSFALSLLWPTLSRMFCESELPDAYFAALGYAGFLVIGGRCGASRLTRGNIIACTVVLLLVWAADILGTRLLTVRPEERAETLLHFLRPQVVAQSVTAFLLLMHLGRRTTLSAPSLFEDTIRLISRYSLGIYLLHPFVLDILWSPRVGATLQGAGPLFHIPLALCATLLLAALFGRIPFLGKAVT